MSGYLEGILVLLAVNVVFAYGGFLPLAAGQLNLGLAGFAAIGAYASAYLSNVFKLSPLIAIPSAGIVAGLVALVVAVPVLRTRGIYLALATFALGQIVQAIILNLEIVGGAAGYPVAAFIRLPTIAAVAAIVVLLVWLLFGTRFGIAVTAVHDDERVADLMGIDVRAFQIAAFALGSAIAGIGGGLYAHHFSFIEAQYFNISLSITIVLYVLLGGTQTVLGPLLGAAVFTLLPEVLRASANWRYVVFAAALIVIMALRPEGLVTGAQLRRLFGWHRAGPPLRDRRRHCREERASMTAADPILRLEAVSKHFGGLSVIEDLSFAVRRGTPHGADRPERRRQDHGVQPDHRGLSGRCRPHSARRRRHHRHSFAPAHRPRHRAQLPEHPADAASEHAGKRHGGAALPQQRHRRRAAAGQPRSRATAGATRRARRSPMRGSATTSARRSGAFPMACRSGSSSCAR